MSMEPLRRRPLLFTSRFWRAFWAGLASPVSLYEETPEYPRPLRSSTVGQSFAEVGRSLSAAIRRTGRGPTNTFNPKHRRDDILRGHWLSFVATALAIAGARRPAPAYR